MNNNYALDEFDYASIRNGSMEFAFEPLPRKVSQVLIGSEFFNLGDDSLAGRRLFIAAFLLLISAFTRSSSSLM